MRRGRAVLHGHASLSEIKPDQVMVGARGGYRPSVVAGATATRALPGPDGSPVPAAALQTASLAAIADLFGVIVPTASDVPA